jgi:hypothetical protein
MKVKKALVGSFLLILLAGCGRGSAELASVEGTVKKGEKPLANIEVVFVPTGGTPGKEVAVYTDAQGKYQIQVDSANRIGIAVGTHCLLVRDADMYLVAPDTGVDAISGESTGQSPKANPRRKTSRIPLDYSDTAKTPLKNVQIKSGVQTLDIDIPDSK